MESLKFPTKDLQNRYSIGRTALYARLAAAKITPTKDGNRAYISGKDLEELDRLESHIKTGGKMEEFKPTKSEIVPAAIEPHWDLLELAEAVARHLSKPSDPLQHYTALERAIASGWLLSTAEVEQLIKTKPHGDRFQRGSFVFIKAGKMGNQAAWRVAKVVEGGSYRV